jgi:hypothetical protein
MKSSDLIDRLLLCDGEGLSCAMAARSGSGKTVLLTHLIESASRLDRFKNQRFVYASMKQETNFDAPIVGDMTSLVKALKKNRIVTYYPTNPETYEEDIDELIETVFSLAEENPDSGFHLTLDDANVMRGFTNRGEASASVRKLVIAGRSKGVRSLLVTHRLAMLPRLTNANLSGMLLLSMNSADADYGNRVLGMDLDSLIEGLGDYRFAYVDLINESVHRFNPIPIEQ